ncbi:MAG: xylulokinase [SAR324 cluster bacterium]|nr:xylulokinase [SAR324 cluster bacterium]
MYLGIDLGTSAVKLLLLNSKQQILAEASVALTVHRPEPLWSEQEPEAWWHAVQAGIEELCKQHSLAQVKGIGLSGQMHGATLLDAQQQVLRPAILWNDGRSNTECEILERQIPNSRQITGNLAMPGFTAPKLLWLKREEPALFEKVDKVLLPKDFLRLRLSGEMVSEMSDAAGTLWLDVEKRDWSDTMLSATGLSRHHMPKLIEGTEFSGVLLPELSKRWGIKGQPVIAGGAGDNAAGAVGIGAIQPGSAFLSLGTSGVYFVVTPSFLPAPERGVHAFCHCLPRTWHQMGVILSAASCLSWLSQLIGCKEADLLAALDRDPVPSGAPLFLPYLSGERTPHNDSQAQGVFFGLNHNHDARHLTQAVLEGVSCAFADCQQVLVEAGAEIGEVSLIGGGARSRAWGQILATMLQRPLIRHSGAELGPAFGAARLGLLAAEGGDQAQFCSRPPVAEVLEPQPELVESYRDLLQRYRRLYPALQEEFQSKHD